MFERFTDQSRRVLVLAQEEARRLDQGFIGTEHLLLGLLRENEGVAALALQAQGVSTEMVRAAVRATVAPSGAATSAPPPFTPRAKKVLELALREALRLGHNYVGSDHLLLGVVRGPGVAADVLTSLGVDLSELGAEVADRLGAGSAPPPPTHDEVEIARRELEAARRFVQLLAAEVRATDPAAVELVDRIAPVLARLHALHGEALNRLVQMIEAWRGEIFLESVRRDELVGPLLAAHGLGSATSGHRFMVSEILQIMYWLHGEGFATTVAPEAMERITGRSAAELKEWFELMTKMGLVERDGDRFRLTAEGIEEGSAVFKMW